jgi:hypothetical protein
MPATGAPSTFRRKVIDILKSMDHKLDILLGRSDDFAKEDASVRRETREAKAATKAVKSAKIRIPHSAVNQGKEK